ncbi:CC0125/CC1285 family lipoprotein [Mitsuaria sp. WAJ17]|uniref:CC0125/CC1285 family lipoprotein n=1 Tax=Mitsuaria sp. WAJ17 TaxID=2761452 RepID=UPI0038576A16
MNLVNSSQAPNKLSHRRPLSQLSNATTVIQSKVFRALLLFATISLGGCATPYQSFELFGRGGYQEKRISDDFYQVIYYGNGATSMDALNSLLMYRSADLTLTNGYDYFVIQSGRARMPLSTLGGFRTAEHTIKLFKGQPDMQGPLARFTYDARLVKERFGQQISQQK